MSSLSISCTPYHLASIVLSTVALLGNTASTLAQTAVAETTLALCETPSQTIRIYRLEGATLMRAYDRQDDIVWLDRTPASPAILSAGTRYTNQLGEQTVTLFVPDEGNTCSLQLGEAVPEVGTLQQREPTSAATILHQARQFHPEPVAQFEIACQPRASLAVKSFQNEGQPPRASFICWSAPDAEGTRTGQWLGNLPLTADDPTFVRPLTCPADDQACEAQLSALQGGYPEQLAAAEFACLMKSGTLFLVAAGDTTDIRCGFFATPLWDTDGDDVPDYEDALSVDISVGQLQL